jgi:hypothetical protein
MSQDDYTPESACGSEGDCNTRKALVRLIRFNIITQAIVLVLGAITGMPGYAQGLPLLEVGVRAGFEGAGAEENFRQYDLFAVFEWPARYEWLSEWELRTLLNASVGALEGGGETGFISTFGPGIVIGRPNCRLAFDAGVGIALLTQDTFGRHDFGGPFQFVAHGGISYRLLPQLEVGYRIHHMSDAEIFNGSSLNQHMLELSLSF